MATSALQQAHFCAPRARKRSLAVTRKRRRCRCIRYRGKAFAQEFGEFPDPGPELASNKMVQQEADAIYTEFMQLSRMQHKFMQSDTEGKRAMIGEMERLLERLTIFTQRFRWSDDAFAKEAVRRLDTQLAQAGMSFDSMTQMLQQSLEGMRQQVEREERLGPAAAAEEASSAAEYNTPPDVSHLLDDPSFLSAMHDASAIAAYQEALQYGPKEAINRYSNNANAKYIIERVFQMQDAPEQL